MVTLRHPYSSSANGHDEPRKDRAELESGETSALMRPSTSPSDSAKRAAPAPAHGSATTLRVVLASLTVAALALLAFLTMHPLLYTLRTFTPSLALPLSLPCTPPSTLPNPLSSSPSSPSPSANLQSPVVSRYELCPRASSPLADSDLSLLSLNHFLLPHGPFSFPSANLSSTPLHTPPNLPPHKPPQNISSPHHLELYIQEALYLPHLHQLQLAVISLPGGQLPRKNLLYDWERTEMAMDLMAAGLEVETSLGVGGGGGGGRGRRVGLGEARLVGQVYWLHFPMVEESKGEPLRDHFTVDLFHDHFTSTSSRCVGDGAWCRRSAAAADSSSSSAPFLRVSVCLRSYPRVSVSMCSSALHSPAVMPHLRAWLTYHAVLGVQRFVIYDHGYYEEALRPYVEAGLVEWRYWPLPNRNFSQDTGADFSQLSLIVVCGALADVTSDYVLYFDTDEWLNFPSHDLTADELQGALPSEPELQPLQQGKLQPSTCLGFRKSPLTVDPDVRLDLSAHATAAVPALRCESVLERFLSAYRLSMIRRRVHRLRELHAQLMLATDAKSEEYGSLHSRYTKLRTTPSDPTDFPLFVYNFVETHAERQTREANELTAHSSHTQRVLAHNTSTSGAASAVVHYFAAAPQRFHRRLRIYRAGRDHKAIYRTPVRRDLWIHPLIPLDEFVNPNALRINHYGSIIHTRWLTEDEKETVIDDEAMRVMNVLLELNAGAEKAEDETQHR